ncbi:hypothetical protein DFH01_04655 [Falsiroseomonas bella]|uniref:Outer membrane protein assembly factor BamE n=1 Tax=Falsiroseomonas bella TaxID=2184016 RepID=A0A317FHT4_9PROT|nr:hypothetical protein [Falsiroseomonas bella]PWS38570.1 hypothetical protein DFH01_04655 [Falsiroseomonas bella]
MRGPARAGLLLALLLPVACAQPGPPEAAQVLEEVLAAHNASIAGVQGRPVAAASVAAQPASAPAAAPSPARAGGAPPDAAGDLVGLTPEALRQQLGEPRLRRPEGPAEVWHYQASQCHLDLVLYPADGPRAGLRVGFASARSVGTARRGEAACLRDIARSGGTRRAPATEQALAGA